MTLTVGRRPKCPFGTAALDSVQLRIWHSPRFCPHARRVSVWLTTSFVSQRTNNKTTMRFGLGWTKISSNLPTLISKEIGTIFSALQSSSPWFPYSTSIVWHVSRRLRVLSLASYLTASKTKVGNFIDNDTLRIGVAFRVGLTVCIPHRCKCGTTVDAFGTHPLSCRFSAWRIPRHSALSDVVRRGLYAAGIPSMLEPSGLDRGDGKRPDGIAVYPYSSGTLRVSTRFLFQRVSLAILKRNAFSISQSYH